MSIVGQRFGSLIVIAQYPRAHKPDGVTVRCDCGQEKETCSRSVRRGRTVSCGCAQRASATRHGASNHPEYARWNGMVQRCLNPSWTGYQNYGGRGISVCQEWRDDPWSFFAWLEAQGGGAGQEVDRIDNSGPYCPENCHLVSRTKNMRNTRSNNLVSVGGEVMSVAEAADRHGLPYHRVYQRIMRLGWPVERALGMGGV